MSFYFLLTVGTVAILLLAILLWSRTHSISILVGIGMMYYWSLFGAWTIVSDRLTGDTGKSYSYLEEKLFPVHLDGNYFTALVLYIGFLIVIEMCLLLWVKEASVEGLQSDAPIRISHGVLLAFGTACGLGSYFLVRDYLQLAEGLNLSGYVVTRGMLGESVPFFTIHQILSRTAFLSAAIGLSVICSGRYPRLFMGRSNPVAIIGYVLLAGSLFWFALMLGNKNELLFAGIFGALLYEANAEKQRLLGLMVASFVGLVLMRLIDTVRGLPLSAVADAIVDVEPSQWFDLVQFLLSTNEAYAAHFSLYGVLALKVPLTYGQSFVSGIASIVPRVLWPDRPPDIYYYYAEQVGAVEGQGYTIHHATGWYLNFGILGIIVGGVMWGGTWAMCFVVRRKWAARESRFLRVCGFIAPAMFVASIPMLMRVGVEGYKGFIVEGLLLPTMLLVLASNQWIRSRKKLRFVE